jgi:hypothetical protein
MLDATSGSSASLASPETIEGSCRVLYCLDVARGIDLARAEERLASAKRPTFHHKSRVPAGGGGLGPALRLRWPVGEHAVGARRTAAEVEVALFDFGALCVTWSLPLAGRLADLVALSGELYEHTELAGRSRALADEVVAALGPAVQAPGPLPFTEDYVVFQVRRVAGGPQRLLSAERQLLARILRVEAGTLSEQEVADALAHPVSYGEEDLSLIDWRGAFLLGGDTEDERLVLELATVELLELRVLDSQLDRGIAEAYDLLARRRKRWDTFAPARRELERVGRMQADDALLHEGIDNALKLLGDDYLARLYRTAAARFHFDEWDAAIERKLGVLRSVHQSLADILLYFTPWR